MDHYTVTLIQGENKRDITAYIKDLTITDDVSAYAVEMSFDIAVNPFDRFLKDLKIEPKDGIRFANNGKTVFEGFVTTRTKAGKITCMDKGFYFKSDITVQFSKANVNDAISRVCKLAGVSCGTSSLPAIAVTGEYIRQQANSVLDDIITQLSNATGWKYIHRIINGKLVVRAYDEQVTVAKFTRPVSAPMNITWALGEAEVTSSMADMATHIVVQTDKDSSTVTLASATDKAAAQKYGYITKILTVDADASATANAVLSNAIAEYGKPEVTASVPKIWGNDSVIPGTLLGFSSDKFGLSGKWWVTAVNHIYQPYHYMSLTLLQWSQPLQSVITASGSSSSGSATTTTTTKTKLGNFRLTFYAGDTSTASGKRPAVGRTIAVDPKVIPLGTEVYIDGWGYRTAEDTGGVIKGNRIDIFVASESEARRYGVKYADVYKVVTTTTAAASVSGGSSAGQKLVDVALGQEGYKSGGSGGRYDNKFGRWFGFNNVAWCAIFVAWCANQAGIPVSVIPKMSSVSSYWDFYKKRGRFHAKSSGYRPVAGDLMIQKNNASHIGIVIRSTDSRFYTIEGNSSNGVRQRNYSYSDGKLTGFCSPF